MPELDHYRTINVDSRENPKLLLCESIKLRTVDPLKKPSFQSCGPLINENNLHTSVGHMQLMERVRMPVRWQVVLIFLLAEMLFEAMAPSTLSPHAFSQSGDNAIPEASIDCYCDRFIARHSCFQPGNDFLFNRKFMLTLSDLLHGDLRVAKLYPSPFFKKQNAPKAVAQ